jgi:hypothetical protein
MGTIRFAVLAIVAVLTAASANAEDCKSYPAGPKRFACASARHPGLVAKRAKCQQEVQSTGVRPGQSMHAVAYRDSMVACMQRRR